MRSCHLKRALAEPVVPLWILVLNIYCASLPLLLSLCGAERTLSNSFAFLFASLAPFLMLELYLFLQREQVNCVEVSFPPGADAALQAHTRKEQAVLHRFASPSWKLFSRLRAWGSSV